MGWRRAHEWPGSRPCPRSGGRARRRGGVLCACRRLWAWLRLESGPARRGPPSLRPGEASTRGGLANREWALPVPYVQVPCLENHGALPLHTDLTLACAPKEVLSSTSDPRLPSIPHACIGDPRAWAPGEECDNTLPLRFPTHRSATRRTVHRAQAGNSRPLSGR